MAGINNQPNLKPLIDEQTEIQKLDFSWLKSVAAANRTKLDQTLADVATANQGINATQQAIDSAKAETAQAITDKQALTGSAINDARDLVISQLSQQLSELALVVDGLPKSPVKSIQRGILNATGIGTVDLISLSSVDMSKSFISVSVAGQNSVQAYFGNSSELRIKSNANSNLYVSWEVIEYV